MLQEFLGDLVADACCAATDEDELALEETGVEDRRHSIKLMNRIL